ncbi:MAG: DNA primase [Burkholderiales bacterium]|nr:DNA primase [Phycisphaerae bacterium]
MAVGTSVTSRGGGLDGKTLVLGAADLVQLIGQTVALKKRGSSFIGLCPFHSEKTPSFHVHPDRGYFHCFGCKASGNAIDFVMKRDRLEFFEAMQVLAQQYNIELPKSGTSRESTGLRQLLLDAHSHATTYFEQNLAHPSLGKPAREYLKSRGFEDETIKRFRIGLASQSWDGLLGSPLMTKFSPETLHQAGLAKAREGATGFYDTFRDRIIFPIRDEAGRVIAFGGRVMPGSDNPAKYLNSPETPLFSKSKVCFGLDLGRQRVVETKTVAIVEGYTDVVMAHQFGASNVVSVLGTALTEPHVALLRRFADRIVLLFDGDAAGDLAVDRALQLFLTQPIEIAIATLPGGMDPDEYLLKNGTAAFDDLLKNAEDALSFQWRQLFKKLVSNESDLTGRSKAIEAYLERLAAARTGGPVDPIRWGSILARVSKFTDIPTEQLNRRFRARKPLASPRGGFDANRPKNPAPDAPRIPGARQQAERWVLGCLLHLPDAWQSVQQVIDYTEFTVEDIRPLAEWYWAYQRNEGQPLLAELAALLDSESLKSVAIGLANEVETMNNLQQTLAEAVQFVQREKERSENQKLVNGLRRSNTEPRSDDSEVDALRRLSESARIRSGT